MAHNEGLTWIGQRTNQFRYSSGGEDRWVQPLSNYIAGEPILRGQPVSIAVNDDIVELALGADDNIVVLTRTSRHTQSIGIAQNPAAAGELVHVLNHGRCSYRSGYAATEYYPSFVNADRGKAVYIGPTTGTLTLDRTLAITGGHNLIQVGSISNTSNSTTAFDIEVEFTGDGRGPLDNTQFEYNIGEDVWYKTGTRPPLFAVGNDASSPVVYNLKVNRPISAWPVANKWLAIYGGNKALVIIFGPAVNLPASTTADDAAKLLYIRNFAGSVDYVNMTSISDWGSPWLDDTDLYNAGVPPPSRFVNSLIAPIISPSRHYLVSPSGTLSASCTPILVGMLQTAVNVVLTGAINGGPIYFDWDSSLTPMFTGSSYTTQGSYGQAGTAILADKRFADRSNVLGFLLNSPNNAVPFSPSTGSVGLFMRKGVLRFLGSGNELIPGARYYLDTNGQITPSPGSIVYPEALVEVGTARNTTDLMVDIGQPLYGIADYPIAYMKPLAAGQTVPDVGWLLTDGATSHLIADYIDLYNALFAIFGGPAIFEDALHFHVPSQTSPIDGRYYQIKAVRTSPDYEPLTTIVNTQRTQGTVSTSGTVSMNISSLTAAGPQLGAVPSVDRLISKLYVLVAGTTWKEIPVASWTVINNSGVYTIEGTIGSNTYNGNSCIIVVYKPEALARFNEAQTVLSTITPSSNLPVNSQAVKTYVEAGIVTAALTVTESVTFGNTVGLDQLTMNGPIALNNQLSATTIFLDPETGLITAAALPVNSNQLANKQYVDNHAALNVTSSATVHGIRQGFSNSFDGDMVDNRHVGGWGWITTSLASSGILAAGITVNTSTTVNRIPEIRGVDGLMETGKTIRMFPIAGTGTVYPHPSGQAGVDLSAGSSLASTSFLGVNVVNSAIPTIQLRGSNVGETSRTNITATATGLEITSDETPIASSTSFRPIKAAAFQTVSTIRAKQDVRPFTRSALTLVKGTEIVEFALKNDPDRLRAGFIAENTDALLSGKNHNEMDLGTTVSIALKAIQELSTKNDRLEKQVRRLSRALAKKENRL